MPPETLLITSIMVQPVIPRKKSTVGATATTSPTTSNFRPFVEKGRWAATGTIPLPKPVSVGEIFTKVLLHGCRKVLFLDPKIRLIAYAVLLFFFSLVSDYLPFPRSYFSQKDHFLNVYFVKFSWAWTFVFTGTFMYLTSATYCCGNRDRIIRHMLRLFIGTCVWFFCTSIFQMIETSTGQCVVKDGLMLHSIRTRKSCIGKSGKWSSFDISGHSFLLIWCIFVITEEAKAIIGWDGIKDMIRNEEHNRSKPGDRNVQPDTPLNTLSDEELFELTVNYEKFDVPAKVALIVMTCLSIIWDIMILMTAIYFHVMVEKVIGGLFGVLSWFLVYKVLYKNVSFIPVPGQGLFKYSFEKPLATTAGKYSSQTSPSASSSKSKDSSSSSTRQKAKEIDPTPKFLGMPMYALRNAKNDKSSDRLDHIN